ncbi:MAG TPA: Crp/Fnr family transcriptional regulator [Candidatus Sulfotelmatobacter sp.]|nr:Crp/Fnr family transcriptional regulator [Candidatus Sulfotelmatobacter sp.]
MIAKSRKSDSGSVRAEANHILQELPVREYERLAPHLQPVPLVQDQVIFEVGAPILGGYFVNSGLVSHLTVMGNGDSVEVGLLGNEGFAGLPILLNIAHSSARITVQITGDAMRINADALHELLPELPMLERLLSRFTYLQALQAQQIAACNRLHEVDERLARWLLMTQDRVRLEILPLTHDLLAGMLGTRRSSVTVAAGILQRAGIIDYRRGKVHILNRQKLEEAACECYAVVNAQLRTYLETGMVTRPHI